MNTLKDKLPICSEKQPNGYCFQIGKSCPYKDVTNCEDWVLLSLQYHHHKGANMIVAGEIQSVMPRGEME